MIYLCKSFADLCFQAEGTKPSEQNQLCKKHFIILTGHNFFESNSQKSSIIILNQVVKCGIMNKLTNSLSDSGSQSANDKDGGVTSQRIASIDILRAMTMVLMIFVNDFWTLKGVPYWMEHRKPGVDGIGLSDVVFPAFLFIVGLSLPYAINNRRKKGDTDWQIVLHILLRTVALLVMGVFLVNGETYNEAATGMPEYYYTILCGLSFILIWNTYPATINKYLPLAARIVASIILIAMAFIYRGGHDGNIQRFAPQWWGILGLIGWAYLASALITLFARNRFYPILAGWLFFSILSMIYKAGIIPRHSFISFIPNAILGGTLTGLTMGGVLTSVIFRYFVGRKENGKLTLVLLLFSAILIGLSVITHPYWGLAKLGATPAWLFLCSAFTILAFLLIYWIADVYARSKWFEIIKPAGTATILCYLVPYFVYSVREIFSIHLPDALLMGGIGLIKSFLFALFCVFITGVLIRSGIKMKL
jgi:heparan-alpha-glucosaminide N-acetyltransferase